MTKYEQYLQITQAVEALLAAAWAVSAVEQRDFPYNKFGGGPALVDALIPPSSFRLRADWEKSIAAKKSRAGGLLLADYVAQRDALMTLLREMV